MDEPKVQLATIEIEEDGRTILMLRTVENLDVRFEIDDVALGALYFTAPYAIRQRFEESHDETRAFWRQADQ